MEDSAREALDAPSQHPMPDTVPEAGTWRLRLDGLVRRPLTLSPADWRTSPRLEHQGSFTCERGWEPGRARWQGVSLAAVLALAQPLPEATAIYAHAGGFRSLVPLAAVHDAFLADALDGHPLTPQRGAPCRLVVYHPACQLSMKWLDRLELIQATPEAPVGPRRPD